MLVVLREQRPQQAQVNFSLIFLHIHGGKIKGISNMLKFWQKCGVVSPCPFAVWILLRVSNLFTDSNAWPSCRTGFYLGIYLASCHLLLLPPSCILVLPTRLTHPAFNSRVAFGVWFAAKPRIMPKIVSGNRFDQHSPSPLDCLLYSTLLFIPKGVTLKKIRISRWNFF